MPESSPSPFVSEIAAIALPIIRSVYDLNAGRHDPLVGDDAMTFATGVWRNSWAQLEQGFEDAGWSVGRPDGSFTATNGAVRVHFYRRGNDELADPWQYNLGDDPSSATKRFIAASNSTQLTLDLGEISSTSESMATLRDLVVLHAGNPDDGCCGVWVGAPTTSEHAPGPWAWLTPVWLIERSGSGEPSQSLPAQIPHYQLPEPDLDLRPIDEPAEGAEGNG